MNAETARQIFADCVRWVRKQYASFKRQRLLHGRTFAGMLGEALKVAYGRERAEAARMARIEAELAAYAARERRPETAEVTKARARLMSLEAAERPSPRERAEADELRHFLRAA